MVTKILCCTPMPGYLHDTLTAEFDCHDYHFPSTALTIPEVVQATIRGMAMTGEAQISAALLDQLPALEIISVFGAGYDGVPMQHCRERGIRVAHTPGLMTDDAADLVTALVLMTGRNLLRADTFARSGDWTRRSFPLSSTITGKCAGIFGLGRIGMASAHRLSALGMQICYSARSPRPDVPWRFVPDLENLSRESDFLVMSCPGGAATRGIVDQRILEALGPEGILINAARGSVIDETALIAALNDGTIRAAGLDVFSSEPSIPPELAALDNTVLLPHIGSATRETRAAMAAMCRANLHNWFSGAVPVVLVPQGE